MAIDYYYAQISSVYASSVETSTTSTAVSSVSSTIFNNISFTGSSLETTTGVVATITTAGSIVKNGLIYPSANISMPLYFPTAYGSQFTIPIYIVLAETSTQTATLMPYYVYVDTALQAYDTIF